MLAFLMTGTDPFEDPELCWAFGKGHPALEYLQEWGFEWPTTGIVPSWGDGDTGEPETWPQVGLLKHYGYKVGESGKPRSQRRKVLRQVFTARELHRVKSKEHMQEWGEPSSARRLQKMANCIASFVRNHTRKRNAPTKAICDWEEDLAWLREEFYQGSFQWPSTYIYR